jgi:hypothetical protein
VGDVPTRSYLPIVSYQRRDRQDSRVPGLRSYMARISVSAVRALKNPISGRHPSAAQPLKI